MAVSTGDYLLIRVMEWQNLERSPVVGGSTFCSCRKATLGPSAPRTCPSTSESPTDTAARKAFREPGMQEAEQPGRPAAQHYEG